MYEKKQNRNFIKKFLTAILLVILSSTFSIIIYDMYLNIDISNYSSNVTAVRLDNTKNSGESSTENITQTLETVTQCVVGISKVKSIGETITNINTPKLLGLGTGTIISSNGYIITNWHVAGNKYSNCYVSLSDGTQQTGEVVWSDADLDLAIVKIKANNSNYISLGNSDEISLGDTVYAIGNPIGIELQRTVTKGIISGLNRTVKIEENEEKSYMESLIQTDASINSGNSGGPLINENGELIGINTVKIETAEGIGFAIPINTVKTVLESFINTGKFNEAYLGIFAYDSEVIKYLNNSITFENGIYIAKISTNGPAHQVGLQVGDIILSVDENPINKMSDLRKYIYTKSQEDTINLTILRKNKEIDINVKLQKK